MGLIPDNRAENNILKTILLRLESEFNTRNNILFSQSHLRNIQFLHVDWLFLCLVLSRVFLDKLFGFQRHCDFTHEFRTEDEREASPVIHLHYKLISRTKTNSCMKGPKGFVSLVCCHSQKLAGSGKKGSSLGRPETRNAAEIVLPWPLMLASKNCFYLTRFQQFEINSSYFFCSSSSVCLLLVLSVVL